MIMAWFIKPIPLTGVQQLLLLLPLCLVVSVVYKTTRLNDLRELPQAAFINWVLVVSAMLGLGAGFYLLHRIMA